MQNAKPYCIMPWVHTHVAERGQVKACCVAQIPFGNINTDNYDTLWNGKAIKSLRQSFLSGQPDNRCKVCINQELAGAKSIRQETWEKFSDIKEFPVQADAPPTYFDIRFSNICNYRCRTCWHGASSKWHAEAKLLKRTKSRQAIILNIEKFDDFIVSFGHAFKHAREFYFAGGEPLITENHYRLLEWLIKENATSCKLRYNTNFSTLHFKSYNLMALWRQFESVEILASIDAEGELGEYVRKDMDWQSIIENCRTIKNEKHIAFKLAPTVSVLSVYHLPDLYLNFVSSGYIQPRDIYLNILDRPVYYNIKAFPKSQKNAINQKYQDFFSLISVNGMSDQIIQEFQSILDFMNHEDLSLNWPKFLKETETIDQLRGEKLMSWWYDDLHLIE